MAIEARWIRVDRDTAFSAFARAQSRNSRPAVLWRAEGERCAYAVVAPLKFAPGRRHRWPAWALAPLVAAWRRHGIRACLEADGIRLSGARIAECHCSAVGDCVVAVCSFEDSGREFMEALRERIEAQHGWQFDHCWPSAAERHAMASVLA
jgi:hypothetical protein